MTRKSNEAALWQALKKRFDGAGIHAVRIEDMLAAGTPDVNYCGPGGAGWIELKHVDEWPKRTSTGVRIGLTAEQGLWLHKRARAGGRADVLVRIDGEVFLIAGVNARSFIINPPTRERFVSRCGCVGWVEIMQYLEGK